MAKRKASPRKRQPKGVHVVGGQEIWGPWRDIKRDLRAIGENGNCAMTKLATSAAEETARRQRLAALLDRMDAAVDRIERQMGAIEAGLARLRARAAGAR